MTTTITDPATLLAALAADHPTVDDLADFLDRCGVRGIPSNLSACVIAEYLRGYFPDARIVVHPVASHPADPTPCGCAERQGYVDLDDLRVPLPAVINELAEHFDDHDYPDLIIPEYDVVDLDG